jgi:hypothetical protein
MKNRNIHTILFINAGFTGMVFPQCLVGLRLLGPARLSISLN